MVMREEYLRDVNEYNGRFEKFIEHLEEDHQWQIRERAIIPDYAFGKDGISFVCEVKVNGVARSYNAEALSQ